MSGAGTGLGAAWGTVVGEGKWLKGAMVQLSHQSRPFVSQGAAVGWPTGQGCVWMGTWL